MVAKLDQVDGPDKVHKICPEYGYGGRCWRRSRRLFLRPTPSSLLLPSFLRSFLSYFLTSACAHPLMRHLQRAISPPTPIGTEVVNSFTQFFRLDDLYHSDNHRERCFHHSFHCLLCFGLSEWPGRAHLPTSKCNVAQHRPSMTKIG